MLTFIWKHSWINQSVCQPEIYWSQFLPLFAWFQTAVWLFYKFHINFSILVRAVTSSPLILQLQLLSSGSKAWMKRGSKERNECRQVQGIAAHYFCSTKCPGIHCWICFESSPVFEMSKKLPVFVRFSAIICTKLPPRRCTSFFLCGQFIQLYVQLAEQAVGLFSGILEVKKGQLEKQCNFSVVRTLTDMRQCHGSHKGSAVLYFLPDIKIDQLHNHYSICKIFSHVNTPRKQSISCWNHVHHLKIYFDSYKCNLFIYTRTCFAQVT